MVAIATVPAATPRADRGRVRVVFKKLVLSLIIDIDTAGPMAAMDPA
jgi:hypothetical protein